MDEEIKKVGEVDIYEVVEPKADGEEEILEVIVEVPEEEESEEGEEDEEEEEESTDEEN